MKNFTFLKIASLLIFFTTAVFAYSPTTSNPLSSRNKEINKSVLSTCEVSDNIILNNNTPSENSVSSITVNSGENVTISGNHTLGYNESITVASGGTLTITGSLTATSSEITVSIDGTLNVIGNYVAASSGHSHTFNGNVYVGGNFQNGSQSTVNVYGSLEITGQLKLTNGGKLEGFSGHITYSSVDVNNCGGSYLKCNTTGFGQNINCSNNTPFPANGIDFSTCQEYTGPAATELFYEDFDASDPTNESDNATSGAGASATNTNGVSWSTDITNANPFEFMVHGEGSEWHAKKVSGTATWQTEDIIISNYTNLEFTILSDKMKDIESGDSISLKYSVDGGETINLMTFTNDVDDNTTIGGPLTGVTGDVLRLYIEVTHAGNKGEHEWDDIKLTGLIDCNSVTNNVTNAGATVEDTQATLTWYNPNATCYSIDEVLIVAKQGSAVATTPSGDGSAYTGNAAFGTLGTAFDEGFVVYKGIAETIIVTNLTNYTTYRATIFTRSGTTWSAGVSVAVTPSETNDLFYEDFNTEQNNATSGTDLNGITWNSDENGEVTGFFGVYNDSDFIDAVFWAEETDGLAYWYTDNINIEGYENLKLRSFVEFYRIDNEDFIKFYYKVDGGSLQEIKNFTGDHPDQYYEWDLTGATGDNLQIWVEFSSDKKDDYHGIGNIKLSGTTKYNIWSGSSNDDFISDTSKWSAGFSPTPTTNVFVKNDKHLTLSGVDKEFYSLNINKNGNVTVAKDASLTLASDFTKIAGTGAVTLNSDSNEFASIVVEGTATGEITYNKYINYLAYQEWDLVGSPVLNQNMKSFAQTHTNGDDTNNTGSLAFDDPYYALGEYLTEWGNYSNYTTSTIPNSSFPAGKGFQMATNPIGSGNDMEGQTLAFTGEIATASQSIDVQNLNGTNNGYGRRWNLVANPYPSYISAEAFFATNSSVMGGEYTYCYVWRTGDETSSNEDNGEFGKWGIYNMLQNNLGGGDFQIAPGQAFYVAAASSDVAQIQFTPSMRTVTGGDDFINGAPVLLNYKLDLKLYNGSAERAKTKFHFQQGLTLGLEPAYDAAAYNQAAALSSRLPEDDQGVNFQLNAMNLEAAYNQTIPLVVNQQEGQSFRISISNNTLPEDINVYLEDVFNGTLTSLKNQDFELLAQEDLSQDGRFYIRFTTESLAINDVLSPSSITVFKLNTDNFITIKGLSPEMGKTTATLYNMLGIKVRSKTLDNTAATQQISTQGLSSGVYIINLKAGEQAVSKKVIIQ